MGRAAVRRATEEDIPRMVELGRMFLAETVLGGLVDYDPDTVARLIEAYIAGDDTCALVLEQEGYVVGGFLGCIVPLYFNADCRAAQQIVWYVEPAWRSADALKLLTAWEEWCAQRGVTIIFSGRKLGYEQMEKLFERRGYVPLETVHVKKVR